MRGPSNLYIKMAAPGWPGSWNTGIKVTSAAELANPTNLASPDQVAPTVSCIVTQFARESFGIWRFCAFCMREIDFNLVNPRVLKITVTHAVCM